MRILLDTSILLWWLADDARLSEPARANIADPDHTVVVSAASAWEISIKQSLGKLDFDGDLEREVREQGFELLPIMFNHTAELLMLPKLHRDPFDRMLIAQARVERLQILTADREIRRYPVDLVSE